MITETRPTLSSAMHALIKQLGGWRKETWRVACAEALAAGGKYLIETGCYRGTPADGYSTIILAQLAKDIGGKLDSYELSPDNIQVAKVELANRRLAQYVGFHAEDSVTGLAARTEPVSFAYLDSFDCGTGPDFTPCQEHQLAEFEAILPILDRRAVVVLDDHRLKNSPNPDAPVLAGGKTDMTIKRLQSLEWQNAATDYQVVYCCGNTHRLVPHKFAVLTGHLHDYTPLAVRTIYHNRAQYCLRHGYDLRLFRKIGEPYADPKSYTKGFSWARWAELLRLLKSGAYEWVWVCGADTLVTNLRTKLESFVVDAESLAAETTPLPKWPEPPFYSKPPPAVLTWRPPRNHIDTGSKHLIIAGEAVAALQADSFLVKASPEGIAYAQDILDQYPKYKDHFWAENQTMIDLRDKHAALTHIVPQHKLNAFDYSLFYSYGEIYKQGKDCYGNRGQWEPGDFLVHWPGQPLLKRLQLLIRYQPQVVK